MATTNRQPVYTITPGVDHDDAEFVIRRYGQKIGELSIATSGYCDWTFGIGTRIPKRTTQRRLAAIAKQLRNEAR